MPASAFIYRPILEKTFPSEFFVTSSHGKKRGGEVLSFFSANLHSLRNIHHGADIHDWAQIPKVRNLVFGFGTRESTLSVVVDLLEGKVTQRIPAYSGHDFYGHGAFSSDGEYLFSTESDLKTKRSKISIRRTRDFRVEHLVDLGTTGAHQVALNPGGGFFWVAGGDDLKDKYQGFLFRLDEKTGKVIGAHEAPTEARLDHLYALSNEQCLVSATYPEQNLVKKDLLFLASSANESLAPFSQDSEKLSGFSPNGLSVAASPNEQYALSTHNLKNEIHLWDLRQRKLIASRYLPEPMGAAFSEQENCVVISQANGALRRLGIPSLEDLAMPYDRALPSTGSHISRVRLSGS